MGVYETEAQVYNSKLAQALAKMPEFKVPEWVIFVKSGPAKQRPIEDLEFWHKRAASILRQIYKNSIVGVNRLRTRYGSRKDRGFQPPEFRKSGGKIIRTILQQADKAGLTEITKTKIKGRRAGRQLTKKGKELLDSIN